MSLSAPSCSAGPSATEHGAEVVIGNLGIKRVQMKSPKMSLKVQALTVQGSSTVGSILALLGEQTKEG